MREKRTVSLAQRAALTAILREGSFRVGVIRGFTGYARPRLRIYGPSQLSARTFLSLRNAGLVRQIMQDDLKEIWDISGDGIDALRAVDAELAALSPEFRNRRLAAPLEVWSVDSLGLARRQMQSERNGIVKSLVEPKDTQEFATTLCKRANAQFVKSSGKLSGCDVTLGILANECLAVSEAFLKDIVGAGQVDVEFLIAGRDLVKVNCRYIGLSFDAAISSAQDSCLSELIAALCKNYRPGLAEGDEAHVLVSTKRRKSDAMVKVARLPESLSLVEIVNQVRAAVIEVGPDGLRERPILTITYGARKLRKRGMPSVLYPANIEWHKPTRTSRSRRALEGRGGVKANAIVRRVALQLVGVQQPPCRKITLTIKFAE